MRDRYNDETMLCDVNHISHRDGTREALWAGSLVLILGAIFVIAMDMPSTVRFFVIFGFAWAAAASAFFTQRWIAKTASPRKREDPNLVRAEREAETERKIAEARANGDYDRFGKG